MSTDGTQKKRKPTGSANSTAGGTDSRIFTGKPANDNDFSRLKERFRRQNYMLFRSDQRDGSVVYFAACFGSCHLLTADAVHIAIDVMEARRC